MGGIAGSVSLAHCRWLTVGCNPDQRFVVKGNNVRVRTVFKDLRVTTKVFHTIVLSMDLEAKQILPMFDGKLLAPITLPGNFTLSALGTPSEAKERHFAFRHGADDGLFHGDVRNLRVYGRARSAKELQASS